jgi:hypothetical protein
MMQTPKRRERIAGWRVSALHFGRICSDRVVFFARVGAEPSAPVGGEFPTFSPHAAKVRTVPQGRRFMMTNRCREMPKPVSKRGLDLIRRLLR